MAADTNRNAASPVRLSDRLGAAAGMVTPGYRLCDVGCDHAHIPIALLGAGIIPGALGMDVIPGPLEKARENLDLYGEDRVQLRMSDGLDAYRPGEADSLMITGMGGRIIQDILLREPDKTLDFQEMILQPQSELREFREFLRKNDYRILEERILLDEGKYYFPMRVRKEAAFLEEGLPDQELCDRFGAYLLRERSPLLRQYLLQQQRVFDGIRERLQDQEKHSERVREVEEEREALRRALMLWE